MKLCSEPLSELDTAVAVYCGGTQAKSLSEEQGAALVRYARRHRIEGVILGALAPEYISVELTLQQGIRAREQLKLLKELRTQKDAPNFYVLKGLPLAQRYYKSLLDRHVGDLDILVRDVADLIRLETVLSNLGFHSTQGHTQLGPRPRKAFALGANPSHWYPSDLGYQIEIHWMDPDRGKFPEYFQDVASWEAIKFPLGEEAILRPAHLLHYLICHGARSAWRRMKWLVDIELVGRQMQVDDWREFSAIVAESDWKPAIALTKDVLLERLPSAKVIRHLQAYKAYYRPGLLRNCRLYHDAKRGVDFGFFASLYHNFFVSNSLSYRLCMIRSLLFRASDVHYPKGPDFIVWPLALIARPLSYLRRKVFVRGAG